MFLKKEFSTHFDAPYLTFVTPIYKSHGTELVQVSYCFLAFSGSNISLDMLIPLNTYPRKYSLACCLQLEQHSKYIVAHHF